MVVHADCEVCVFLVHVKLDILNRTISRNPIWLVALLHFCVEVLWRNFFCGGKVPTQAHSDDGQDYDPAYNGCGDDDSVVGIVGVVGV